jgi:hypothetical protein
VPVDNGDTPTNRRVMRPSAFENSWRRHVDSVYKGRQSARNAGPRGCGRPARSRRVEPDANIYSAVASHSVHLEGDTPRHIVRFGEHVVESAGISALITEIPHIRPLRSF